MAFTQKLNKIKIALLTCAILAHSPLHLAHAGSGHPIATPPSLPAQRNPASTEGVKAPPAPSNNLDSGCDEVFDPYRSEESGTEDVTDNWFCTV